MVLRSHAKSARHGGNFGKPYKGSRSNFWGFLVSQSDTKKLLVIHFQLQIRGSGLLSFPLYWAHISVFINLHHIVIPQVIFPFFGGYAKIFFYITTSWVKIDLKG